MKQIKMIKNDMVEWLLNQTTKESNLNDFIENIDYQDFKDYLTFNKTHCNYQQFRTIQEQLKNDYSLILAFYNNFTLLNHRNETINKLNENEKITFLKSCSKKQIEKIINATQTYLYLSPTMKMVID